MRLLGLEQPTVSTLSLGSGSYRGVFTFSRALLRARLPAAAPLGEGGVEWFDCADDQPASAEGARQGHHQDQEPRAAGQPPEAGRLRARLHPDAEEAEFRPPQGSA